MSQSQARQKSRFDEIQMLQRQIMFKKLQELQRQQQLEDFGDVRQQSLINQHSLLVNKHASGAPHGSQLINGTPTIHDPSQMFMQGLSQTQSQGSRSMGMVSSYGTTLDSDGNNWNRYNHLQGASHDSASLLVKGNNNQEEKNLFGQTLSQGMYNGVQSRNSQQVNNLQSISSLEQFGGREKQGGWPGLFPVKTTDVESSQEDVSSCLDPLEQKILFNMDNNSSFGKAGGSATGGFDDNTYENRDELGSLQSGSWSALMQSAVGEASSCSNTTGPQEEWSGLSFQNPEPSTDNNHDSNFVESGKQQANWWLDNKFQSASSLNPKPGHLVNDHIHSNFPGFQQVSSTQFYKEHIHSDSSHESAQQSCKKASDWSAYNAQQKHFLDGRESGQRFSPLQSAWPDQSVDCLANDTHQRSRLGYCNDSRNQVQPEYYGPISDNQQLNFMNHAETSFKDGRSESMIDDHPQQSNNPRGMKGQVRMHNTPNSAIDFDKGHRLDDHRNFNASEETPLRSNVGSGVFAFNDRSSGFHAPNITAHTSENMLELHNKVEISKEYMDGTFIGSKDSTLKCEVPLAQNSAASVTQSYNQSSASQYFGLRLAPPTQRLGNSNYGGSFQIPLKSENSLTAFQGHQYERNQLDNHFSVTLQSPQATLSGMGNRFPTSSPPNSQETSNIIYTNPYIQQFSNVGDKQVIQSSTASGTSQHVAFSTKSPNVWTNQENPSSVEPHKFLFGLHSSANATKGRLETDRARHSGSQASTISVKDIEAFGRSLKQSNIPPPQNYSLLNKLHSVKNEETNVPLVTAKSELDLPVYAGSQSFLLQETCQETLISNRDDSQNHFVSNNLASNETHRSQISFPMAPSYVKSYGTSKNGQMLPIYEARIANEAAQKFSAKKPLEGFQVNSSLVQMNFDGTSQANTTTANSVAASHLSSPYLLNSDATDQYKIGLRPKKRKFSTIELLPWHKEVAKGSPRLPNISIADLDWAQAVNRLPEKLNDEVGAIESPLPLARPKKRLIMTTQFMQQLFCPVPAVIFSEDATLLCDMVTYFVARSALGDACNLANHSHMPRDVSDLSSGKRSTFERINYAEFSKLVEDLINRSKRLEGELFRLEKGGSKIVDIMVEFEELEKFSVINRFAKFHIRGGQMATTSNVVKLSPQPQRYVTAIPMPKTVPESEGQQCLSL